MSTLPSLVRLKRKFADEPVDSLYIQHEGPAVANGGQVSYVYRRVTGQEAVTNKRLRRVAVPPEAPRDDTPAAPTTDAAPKSDAAPKPDAVAAPRRYMLSRAIKRKNSTTQDLPTFVEERPAAKKVKPLPSRKSAAPPSTKAAPRDPFAINPAPAKKATAEEPQLVLAPTADSTAPQVPPPQRKYKNLRAPPPRNRSPDEQIKLRLLQYASEVEAPPAAAAEEDADGDTSMVENGVAYTYDFYERMEQPAGAAPEAAAFALGVITADMQDVWESYLDDGSSEENDWNSDQDDENAENYYGADYPEDELSEDDGAGVDAYRYRNRPADEEEWDAERDAWSDEESEGEGDLEREFRAIKARGRAG